MDEPSNALKDVFVLIGAAAVLALALALSAALALGWIEIGLVGGILIIGFLLVGAAVQTAFGLLRAIADFLAGRRD